MSRTAPVRDVNAAARACKAISLRKLGYTLEEIATRAGYGDRAAAHRAIQRELQRTMREPADDLRQLESARMDELLKTFMVKAMKGDVKAAELVLKIGERRAKLLGLDMTTDAPLVAQVLIRQYAADTEAV